MDKTDENSKESRSNNLVGSLNLYEILLILILAIAVFWGGYFLWFCSGFMNDSSNENAPIFCVENRISPTMQTSGHNHIYLTNSQFQEVKQLLEEINAYKSNEVLSISTLNGFYSSLFTAIAVVLAIIALISWRSIQNQIKKYEDKIKQIEDVIEDYNKVKNDVEFLLKKKNYVKRIQEIVESDENSKVSCQLKLTEEDKKTLKEIKEFIMNDHEENAWLEIFVAHDLVFNDEDSIDLADIEAAEKIFIYNESRNLFKPNSVIEPYLYHFMGKLYHVKYDKYLENCNLNNLTEIDNAISFLKGSEFYYNKSLDHRIEKEKLQTRANLAVVLIDLAKCEKKRLIIENNGADSSNLKKLGDYLEKAYNNLIEVKRQKPDFNTYWDLARVAYYSNNAANLSELLGKTAEAITVDKEMQMFINSMRAELKEFNGTGFPGDETIIDSLEKKLKNKFFK